jgi:hypothetical protein
VKSEIRLVKGRGLFQFFDFRLVSLFEERVYQRSSC